MLTRDCTLCKQILPVECFDEKYGGKLGCDSRCKKCKSESQKRDYRANPEKFKERNRRSELKQLYGMTPNQFQSLYERQNGICAICSGTNPVGDLCVDHNHETGAIRGLLCRQCNLMIGNARDRIDLLIEAAAYLERQMNLTL